MRVAIIGTGRVAQAIGGALRRAGHDVIFGARAPAAADEAPLPQAVAGAAAVILATPFDAAADAIAAAGGLAGQVLVDATNPLGMGAGGLGLTMGFGTSGAENIATLAPAAHVVKAFNQTGFENMADARGYAARPVMFAAGNDAAAKATVLTLIADCGFEAVDLGPLAAARLIEPLAMVWIELARKRGWGADFALTLQRKPGERS